MSLLPFVFGDCLNDLRPSRILNQRFGSGLDPEDFLEPLTYPSLVRSALAYPSGYYRPWASTVSKRDGGSTVQYGKDQFQVKLDVQQFKPEEITVKVTGDNTITVEGKHEEKQDEHGYISRHFVRRYVLPKEHDISQTMSSLSSDGVLMITAPRVGPTEGESRNIPIQHTGQPSKPTEEKKEKATK